MRASLQGTKIPFTQKWEYRLYMDGYEYDKFVSTQKLTAEEMLSVEAGYSEALDGYRLRGVL